MKDFSDVVKRHPTPWRVGHEEPYEAAVVDAKGNQIDGLKIWLDDACFDGNSDRLANAEFVVEAVNTYERRRARKPPP